MTMEGIVSVRYVMDNKWNLVEIQEGRMAICSLKLSLRLMPIDGNFGHVTNTNYIRDGIPVMRCSGTINFNNDEEYWLAVKDYKLYKESMEKKIPLPKDRFPSVNPTGNMYVHSIQIHHHDGNPNNLL